MFLKTVKKNNNDLKSIRSNMILNVIKGIMSLIFPLVTFPYISRVLGVEKVGEYNFSNSVISYFVLLSGLGIATYARREGSKIRNNELKFNLFCSEMFTLNIITSIFSYCTLFICIFYIDSLKAYSQILLILSSTIILQTIGIEWIYSIFEDYFFTTIRSIIVQLFSVIMLFLFVKDSSDLLKYVWIVVYANTGSNLINFLYARKYCHIRLMQHVNWRKHLKPILVFFSTTLSISIYVSSDVTILGFICGDYYVGLYSVSVKIYTIIKTILASAIVVSIPRLCAYEGEGKTEKYNETANYILKLIVSLTLPALIGIVIYSKDIVVVLAGEEYLDAYVSLSMLSIALLCYMLAYFWGQCILVPHNKENLVLKTTIISALANLLSNFVLIPIYKQNAAAFTTILGEGLAMLITLFYGQKLVKFHLRYSFIIKIFIGCIPIVIINRLLCNFETKPFFRLLIGIPVSILFYFIIEKILKNECMNWSVAKTVN